MPVRLGRLRAAASWSCPQEVLGQTPEAQWHKGLLPETGTISKTKSMSVWEKPNTSLIMNRLHDCILSRHLFAWDCDGIPEERPENTGIARRGRQRPVVAVIFIQTIGEQRSYVESRNLHLLIWVGIKYGQGSLWSWSVVYGWKTTTTWNSPLYLILLRNFRICSKAGLNSPIYMTTVIRFCGCCFQETDNHRDECPMAHLNQDTQHCKTVRFVHSLG